MASKLSILGIAAGAAVVLMAAGTAFAHGGRGGAGFFMKHAFEHRVSEAEDFVEATPEQRKVIESARDNIETKMKARFEQHLAERQAAGANGQKGPMDPHDMVRLLAADKIDEQAIYAEIDRRAEEMKQAAREILPEVIKAHDALTPAQRQKLAARAEQRHSQMRERWQQHHDGARVGPDDERGGFGGPDHP